MGKKSFIPGTDTLSSSQILDEITRAAAASLATKRIGALIVLERNIILSRYVEVGILLDARVSKELLVSIFHPSSPDSRRGRDHSARPDLSGRLLFCLLLATKIWTPIGAPGTAPPSAFRRRPTLSSSSFRKKVPRSLWWSKARSRASMDPKDLRKSLTDLLAEDQGGRTTAANFRPGSGLPVPLLQDRAVVAKNETAHPRLGLLSATCWYKVWALLLACLFWYIVQGEEIPRNQSPHRRQYQGSGRLHGHRARRLCILDATLRGSRVLLGDFSTKPLEALHPHS